MIIGVFLRNIKTYSGINYIPLTNEHKFCGLIGNNGIGKSSVLEALDCLFNGRPWNHNIVVRKSGIEKTNPHIVPVYLLRTKKVSKKNLELFQKISDCIWNIKKSDISPRNQSHFEIFAKQRDQLRANHRGNSLLIPLGLSHDGIPNLSIFNTKKLVEVLGQKSDGEQTQLQDSELNKMSPLHEELRNTFEYIYIPKDIDPEDFTRLETKEIQSLMGKELIEVIEESVPNKQIQQINLNLSNSVSSLSDALGDYSFRNVGTHQRSLQKSDVYKLIVNAYFKIKKLHKKEGDHWLELSVLSSGEKQKAIIELVFQFLKEYRSRTDNLIIAIDEPESSLHMSACYDQFSKLFETSTLCSQLIFTTHWYGFIPTVENGYVSVISKAGDAHHFDLINIGNYRELIKQNIKRSQGKLPYDIRLKSLNDFIQSVVTSLLSDNPFNWLICEGSSEKIYFEHYFSDIKTDKRLRIIPVGGASEIKRIYNNLKVAYEDFKNEIKGKVVLIADTDAELVSYETRKIDKLICRRIVNSEKKTVLVKMDANPVSPKTEIEDALNGKLFLKTLKSFEGGYPELREITETVEMPDSEESSYYVLDLSRSKQAILDAFFDKDNNKFRFAEKYVDNMGKNYKVPEWIEEIKAMY